MVEIFARNPCSSIVAYGKPDLSPTPGVQIVGCPRTSHLGGTQPGSSALDNTSGQRLATAKASKTSWSKQLEPGWKYKNGECWSFRFKSKEDDTKPGP